MDFLTSKHEGYPPVNKHSNGKSPSWIGHTSSNGGYSIAMLDYRSVSCGFPMGEQKPWVALGLEKSPASGRSRRVLRSCEAKPSSPWVGSSWEPVERCFFLKAPCIITLQGTNISPKNGILKMIFLFLRWDMLIPGGYTWIIYTVDIWYVCIIMCIYMWVVSSIIHDMILS